MSKVVDAITDVVNSVIDAVTDIVKVIWDAVVEPILEQVFAIFGITDETVVNVQKISQPLYADNVEDVVQAGITRAVLAKVKTDTSFFPNYMEQIFRTKAQIRAYYRYGELDLYYLGLPLMEISGVFADYDAIQIALDETFGSTHTVLSAYSHNPSPEEWFRYTLQLTPTFYKPWLNTLTHTDIWGVDYDDWVFGLVDYNVGPDNYTINISRLAEEAQFWIQGPNQVTEGDTATFTIKSNRVIPAGETMPINLAYTGTAVDGVDYTEVASVDMLEGTQEITVDILTAETASSNLNFNISIDVVDNTGGIFETVTIHARDNVNCVITDDDALMLTMNDVLVDEANTTIVIPVKLEQAAPSGAFTVDYNFTDLGSITGGVDYDNTTGTLNFAGTLGETQNISIDIYADIADDDFEQFEVFLENSTDLDSIDTSAVATVTIIDGTDNPAAGDITVNDTITGAAYTPEDSLIVYFSDDNAPPGETAWWIYPHSDLTYSLAPSASTLSDLEMLPMAILRKDKTNIDTTPGTASETYKTTRQLMIRVALELQEFLDNLSENPDISDVDDAYFNFAMAPTDVHPIVSKLLYLAWYQIIVTSGLDSNTSEFVATISEGDVQNAIVWTTQSYTTDIVGVKTTEGDYLHEIVDTTLKLQWQRNATTYDEIVINNLNGAAAINYQSYHEVALYKLGDSEFTIPLSWDTFRQLSAEEQMEVYQYLVRVDFNAIQIIHLEWYETSAFLELFEFALLVVAVVVTIVSFGTLGFTAGLYALVYNYVIAYAIGELVILIAEETGSAILAAAIGVLVAVYTSNSELLTTDALMQADTLIDISTEFANNMLLLEGEKNLELADEIAKAEETVQAEIEAEKNKREDLESVGISSEFILGLQSIDARQVSAITGQYNYDTLYNYDSLVGDYVETRLNLDINNEV